MPLRGCERRRVVGDDLGVGVALLVDAEPLVANVASHQVRHGGRVVCPTGQRAGEAVGNVHGLDREVNQPEPKLLVEDCLQQILRRDGGHNWYLAGWRWTANCSSRSDSTLRIRMSSIGRSLSTEP